MKQKRPIIQSINALVGGVGIGSCLAGQVIGVSEVPRARWPVGSSRALASRYHGYHRYHRARGGVGGRSPGVLRGFMVPFLGVF